MTHFPAKWRANEQEGGGWAASRQCSIRYMVIGGMIWHEIASVSSYCSYLWQYFVTVVGIILIPLLQVPRHWHMYHVPFLYHLDQLNIQLASVFTRAKPFLFTIHPSKKSVIVLDPIMGSFATLPFVKPQEFNRQLTMKGWRKMVVGSWFTLLVWVVVSTIFYFHPENWVNDPIRSNSTNIFQMGWNHQPVVHHFFACRFSFSIASHGSLIASDAWHEKNPPPIPWASHDSTEADVENAAFRSFNNGVYQEKEAQDSLYIIVAYVLVGVVPIRSVDVRVI